MKDYQLYNNADKTVVAESNDAIELEIIKDSIIEKHPEKYTEDSFEIKKN